MKTNEVVTKFLNSLDVELMAGNVPTAIRTRVIEIAHTDFLRVADLVYEDHESDYLGDYRIAYGRLDETATRFDEIAQLVRHLTCGRFTPTVGADLRAALIEEAQAISRKRMERYDRKPKAVEARGCFTPVREWLRSRYRDRIVQMDIHLSVLDEIAPRHITGYMMRTVDGWARHRLHAPAAARIRRDFRRHTRNLKFVG